MVRSLILLLFVKCVVSLTNEDVIGFTSSLPKDGKLWAVLVAGSNTWDNYRHQADVCHSYQVLHNHGIPDEQIVVMMYNDIAHNSQNPTPGVIINHLNGPNVYKGVPLDYTKEDVTPQNFLSVLQGNESAMRNVGSGKVIKSGPKDHVFVYYADHGAFGLVAFPNDDESVLTSDELISFLNKFYQEKRYAKMVLYVEACNSGSMFLNLSKHINIFATTAANKDESSYACYFDDNLETYLGDVYSVKWMEDSDKETISKESLEKQYKIVKNETETSHVRQFGDLTIAKMTVSEFQGRKNAKPITYPKVPLDAVSNRDVPLEILKRKIMKTNSIVEKDSLKKEFRKLIRNRMYANKVIKEIVQILSSNGKHMSRLLNNLPDGTDFDCYKKAVQYFSKECFQLNKNEYVLSHMYILANLCAENMPIEKIRYAIDKVCTHPPICGIK